MGSKSAPIFHIRLLEPAHGQFRSIDFRNDIRLVVMVMVKRVVCLMTRLLQVNEPSCKTLNFQRKFFQNRLLLAGIPGHAMLKGAVHLMPRRATILPDKQIGRG